ncbi:cupin domain-containing protein [uncultured Methanoregula sp.]|uniref:cupin domain-containing protein n=1 Tax=uncultured Methanoregula sp. TaxID=1005933 RepID=UPI002AAAE273|nr:cupin domain-containing protein [uncultured Methanoregula sp.]
MIIKDTAKCRHERVIDRSLLCEILHPDKTTGAEGLGCSVAHAIVPPGESTLPHILNTSAEIYYILSGVGEMHIGPEHEQVHGGQIILIPPEARQYIRNTGPWDLVFLCIVAPKWHADDESLVS